MNDLNLKVNVDSAYSNKFANSSRITIETVECLEDQFDFYEMVSLVFLLYDDCETALVRLAVAEMSNSNIGLLKNWVHSVEHKNEHWQSLFLEALCITQCYAVLRKLGFVKREANERFLPFNEYTSLFVNPIRKALYRLCEKLTDDQSVVFLSYIKEDFLQKPNVEFKDFNGLYLEMYFLHWATLKYIVLSDDAVDLDNVLKVLKVLEMEDFKDTLSSVVADFNRRSTLKNVNANASRSSESLNFSFNKDYVKSTMSGYWDNGVRLENKIDNLKLSGDTPPESKCSQHSVVSNTSESISMSTSYTRDQLYHIDRSHVGVCIIINQKKFTRNVDPLFQESLAEYDLQEREGTDADMLNLEVTWGGLGFTVISYTDVPHYEIVHNIKDTIKKVFTISHGCLVVCVLSHGERDVIYGSDSVALPVSEIEHSLYDTNLNLLGKPKILIIQACQGKPCQKAVPINRSVEVKSSACELTTDGPSNNTICRNTVPEFADLLVCWSTVPGFASFRHKKNGTWFINSFCEVLRRDSKNKHFLDILSAVVADVSSKRAPDQQCMVPIWKATFTKILYFP